MTTKKRRKNRLPPFIPLFKATMATPAWRVMSPIGRLINIELRRHLRNDWLNNGKVHLSCRAGAKAIGINKDSVAQGLAENEHYGFLRKTAEGFLGANGYGIAKNNASRIYRTERIRRRATSKNGWRNVRLHPRRPGRKTESRPVPPDTLSGPTGHTEGGARQVRMSGPTGHRDSPGVSGQTGHI
jgi:hypothetical protein